MHVQVNASIVRMFTFLKLK